QPVPQQVPGKRASFPPNASWLTCAAIARDLLRAAARPCEVVLPGQSEAGRPLPDRLSLLVNGLEVVVKRPGGDLSAQVPGCDVRGAEVEPVPHPGVDDILQQGVAGVVVTHAGRRRGDERQLQVVPGLEQVLQAMD